MAKTDKTDPTIDKEFQALIPPLAPDELAQLEASLKADGCREPLIVWKGENILLDGHNRHAICTEHDIHFDTVDLKLPDRGAARAFIIRNQLARRNLSPLAASYLRGRRYQESKQQGNRTDLTSGQSGPKSKTKGKATSGQSDPKADRASEVLGKEYGVGEKTIRRDGKLASMVDGIVENCGPKARSLILSRGAGMNRGAVSRLSKLSTTEQKKYLEELERTGKRPRRKRSKKPRSFTLPSSPKELVAKLLERLERKDAGEVSKLLIAALKKDK